MEPLTSISPSSRETRSDGSLLLCLPLELRSRIYTHALLNSRCPSSEDVYRNVLCTVWKDKPSPLLAVNRQVRDEVCDILRKGPVTLRVTGQDMKFDSIGLSCFIAQQHCTFTGDIRALIIQVWPPHPERPVETYNIWKNLRRLRDDLRACKQIRRVDIQFRDKDLYSWSQDGVLGYWLSTSKQTVTGPCASDIGHMLHLFNSLNNASIARIKFPDSVLGHQENESLAERAEDIECLMMYDEPDPFHCRAAKTLEDVIPLAEGFLKYQTAILAEKKLIEITQSGRFKMSQADYLDFVKVWPHFETLRYCSWGYTSSWSHYAILHEAEQENQNNKVRWLPTPGQEMAWDIWLQLKGLIEFDLESCC